MSCGKRRPWLSLLGLVAALVVVVATFVSAAAAQAYRYENTATAARMTRTAVPIAAASSRTLITQPRTDLLRGEPAGVGAAHASTSRVERFRAAKAETRIAGDAFEHGYKYHPRVRARGVEDPVAHNFPYSFDDVILKEKLIVQADGSLLYRKVGSVNGKDGVYEIGVNPETNTIFHRTWRSR